jgi:hypothetical protein
MTTLPSIFGAAFSEIANKKLVLFKALLLPFLIIYVCALFIGTSPFVVINLAVLIFGLFQCAIIAITTHRIILLGVDSVPEWGTYKVSFREIYYALHVVGYVVVCWIMFYFYKNQVLLKFGSLFSFSISLSAIYSLLVLLGILLVVSRLSLVFPGIAVNQGVSFKLSWKMTQNHKLLILLAAAVFPITLLIVLDILTFLLYFLPFGYVFISFFSILAWLLIIVMLSVAYKHIYTAFYNRPLAW